jgi:hypothetical protein
MGARCYGVGMTWDFTIDIDDADTSMTTWEAALAGSPRSFWAVGPPPGDKSGTWLVGLHFVVRDGYPILIEQRVVLNEGVSSTHAFGTWSGDEEAVPDSGLPASVVHALTIGSMQNQVRAALADRWHSVWGDGRRDTYDDGEPPDNVTEHTGFTESTGIDITNTAQPEKRGRKPLSDDRLAEVAYHYDQAMRINEPVHGYVETRMSKHGEGVPVAQWTMKARRRGFLTPETKPGQPGGTITAKAIATLKSSGFLDSQGARNTEQEGDDE